MLFQCDLHLLQYLKKVGRSMRISPPTGKERNSFCIVTLTPPAGSVSTVSKFCLLFVKHICVSESFCWYKNNTVLPTGRTKELATTN